jgi:hypothetical protein
MISGPNLRQMGGCDRLPASQTPAAIAISVVAPGFIDLHQCRQDLASQRVKALDILDLTLHAWLSH